MADHSRSLELTSRDGLRITPPDWFAEQIDWEAQHRSGPERMRFVIELSRQNVLRGTGGPFGAAVFVAESGTLIAAAVNSVTRLNNSVLHAETMALMLAQQRLGSFNLARPGTDSLELVSSCEPCAMCLGAIFWSGVRRLVFGAERDDATRLGFDEGPVFPESWRYLEERGITTLRGLLRAEAAAVLELYRESGGPIYNA